MLPRFFKIVKGYEESLKHYRLEQLRLNMNLTNEKNFLAKNVDEQAEWAHMNRERLEHNRRFLEEKIQLVNMKKEQREEEVRKRMIEYQQRWDVIRKQMAEFKVIEQ